MKELVKLLRAGGVNTEIKQMFAIRILATTYQNYQHYMVSVFGDTNMTFEEAPVPQCFKDLKSFYEETVDLNFVYKNPDRLLDFYKSIVTKLYEDHNLVKTDNKDLIMFLTKESREIIVNSLLLIKKGEGNDEDIINKLVFESLGGDVK